jgi:Fe-S cluster assembly protein SufD
VTATPATAPAAAGALARLDGIGFPTRRDEAWRYAPHRLLGELTFGPSESVELGDLDLAGRLPVVDGPLVVIVDGVLDRDRSRLAPIEGVTISSLGEAAAAGHAAARRHLERGDDRVADAYVALNVAYGTDGVVIDVAPGAHVTETIHVVDVAVGSDAANTSSTGVVLTVGPGASATVVESRIGVGDGVGGSNVVTTIDVGEGADVEHVLLQDLPPTQVHLARVEIDQDADSAVRTRSFNLGAAYGRLAYRVELAGAGASAELSGLYFGVGDQTLDQQLTVVHAEPDCTSRQAFRGVLDGASTGTFNGGIDVRPGADGTDAEQANDNLLLSDRAEANSQPRLEILADEVACKHGSTVGQLDDQALYYLRSRGIGADEARRLLINGFADQVVDDVSIEEVREWITRRLGHDHD